ncbi:bromodomain adjacent to zinc finger domain protein 1A isoform X2 [Frankliniella occidentalis]|uniref:Bromodomain adjacent to zinc finger domain protein 1A n=1 Tax=Frankliniella occidentalis TaxID=133901 RepID=A0A9C6TWC5_FRAOC|nr:bromodomain adjacent to zinc finger domain protein 1A isoform X2 [Frankliniella occidentalis]
MPLLDKKPFERKKPPPDLHSSDEVFYCPLTKEIFRDYEEYCERIILCNSLVWQCSLTGRPQLTFEEALKSEQNAKQNLKDFPMELKVPVLYLASKTHRTGILDLVEDIYIYVRDRYFVGETVEVCLTEGGPWTDAYVVHVTEPTAEQLANQDPNKPSEVKDPQRQFQPPPSLFRYEVELSDRTAEDISEMHTLPASQVRRRPRMYSRDRNRLFLKQFLEMDKDGILRIKESELNKYKIHQYKFDQIFAGKDPVFPSSSRAVKRQLQQQLLLTKSPKRKYTKRAKPDTGTPPQGKKSRQETMQKYITMTKKSPNGTSNGEKRGSLSPQKTAAQKLKDKYGKAALTGKVRKRRKFENPQEREQLKIKAIEDKKKRREELLKARAANREKKLELAKFIREWNRQREDLECEDLKILPEPTPVHTKIPNRYFGDMLMVMEFLHSFSETLKVKDFFPNGVPLELLERALVEPEVTGPLNDLLQLLLSALFEMQEDEADALEDANPADLTEPVAGNLDEGDIATTEALRIASAASAWSQTFQGKPLSKVELDSVVLTEVLRLHLLQSGNRAGDISSEWRYRERGGYTTRDDPGLVWKMENMNILKSLSTTSIYELPAEDKLSILTCLINQIMTYVAMRDVIEERMEKTKQVRTELHFADREISKKEREMIEQGRKKRKKHNATEPEEPKVEGENEESEEEEESAEQKAARLAQEKKNNSEKQREIQKRRNQLMDEMMGHTNLPVGSDRAHRRFWLFASLPGLFVEHDERFAGSCLSKPTPHNLELTKMEDTLSYVCKLFEEERNGGSDKENDFDAESVPVPPMGSPSKKLLSEKNQKAAGSPMKSPSQQVQQADDESKVSANHTALLTCNADPSTCPVHATKVERTTWAFYLRDQLDDLIERLSTRGYRESELRTMLIQGKDRVNHSLENCPISKLNPGLTEIEVEVRKSQRNKESNLYKDTLLGHDAGTPLEDILELTLRDLILEMEEKIRIGGLGSLKVKNRQSWRDALTTRSYNKECDKLVWPGVKDESDAFSTSIVDKIKSEHLSRPGTPDSTASSSRDRDPSCYARLAWEVANMGSFDIKPAHDCVRDLACAILQVSQGIDERYLKKPLGLDDKEKSKEKQKKNSEEKEETEKEKDGLTTLQKWQVSLMASTSFSQLFLHLSTLDSSIQWSKSALNANCRLCRRRGDPDQMLLCDGCNKGHHMYCLKPKLHNVPKGDWFCPTCKPKEKKTPAKKARKVFYDDDEDDNLDNIMESDAHVEDNKEPCKSCGKDGSELQCEKCNKCFHLSCAEPRMRKAPRGKWTCEKCKIRTSNRHKAGETSPGDRTIISRRRCAAKAIDNISRFAKQLRSSHGDDDDKVDPGQEVESEENEDRQLHSRRRCAMKAVANISNYAKQLRNQSYDEATNDESSVSRRRSRRSLDVNDDDLPLDNAALQELLEDIIRHKDAWAFIRPVQKSEVPDYHTIIKRPMDFGTIKHKLNLLEYRNTSEVLADALLVFENCDMYNQADSEVYKSGVRLRKLFDKKCREKNLRFREEDVKSPEAKKKKTSP